MSSAPLASLATPARPGRPSRGLSRGSPVGALVVAHWAGRPRRREGETALAPPSDARAALGVSPPPRSRRAAANARRPAALAPRLWATGDARGQARAPGPSWRCPNPRLAVDRTTRAPGVPRVPGARFRTAQGALTGHPRRDHTGHLPALVGLPAGQRRASARGRQRPPRRLVARARGAIAATGLCSRTPDRGYGGTRHPVKAT
jgi:hypothetical protein